MLEAEAVLVPAPCYLEAGMVIAGRRGRTAGLATRRRCSTGSGARVVPFTEPHARLATDAFLRYGKGRHPAGLNFGDCMAYAVAQAEGAPLLFTGGDFARTDVEVAGVVVALCLLLRLIVVPVVKHVDQIKHRAHELLKNGIVYFRHPGIMS